MLFLALYEGRAANKFGLLTGQIIAVDDPKMGALLCICGVVAAVMAVIWRPLTFASVDPTSRSPAGSTCGCSRSCSCCCSG